MGSLPPHDGFEHNIQRESYLKRARNYEWEVCFCFKKQPKQTCFNKLKQELNEQKEKEKNIQKHRILRKRDSEIGKQNTHTTRADEWASMRSKYTIQSEHSYIGIGKTKDEHVAHLPTLSTLSGLLVSFELLFSATKKRKRLRCNSWRASFLVFRSLCVHSGAQHSTHGSRFTHCMCSTIYLACEKSHRPYPYMSTKLLCAQEKEILVK